jgi:hypothetical protein
MKKDQLPPIPKIGDEELGSAVSSLAQAGNYFRQAFLKVAQGADPRAVLFEHLEYLQASDLIIDKFLEEFEKEQFSTTDCETEPEQH